MLELDKIQIGKNSTLPSFSNSTSTILWLIETTPFCLPHWPRLLTPAVHILPSSDITSKWALPRATRFTCTSFKDKTKPERKEYFTHFVFSEVKILSAFTCFRIDSVSVFTEHVQFSFVRDQSSCTEVAVRTHHLLSFHGFHQPRLLWRLTTVFTCYKKYETFAKT